MKTKELLSQELTPPPSKKNPIRIYDDKVIEYNGGPRRYNYEKEKALSDQEKLRRKSLDTRSPATKKLDAFYNTRMVVKTCEESNEYHLLKAYYAGTLDKYVRDNNILISQGKNFYGDDQ